MAARWLRYLLGVAGLAAIVAFGVSRSGWRILDAIRDAGWPLLWLLPFHVLPLGLDALGWRVLLAPRDPQRRGTLPALFWIAAVRGAVSQLLPTANVGGEIVGVHLLRRRGVDVAAGAASVVMEVLLTLLTQYVFIGLATALLIGAAPTVGILHGVLIALLATLPVPVVLLLLLRYARVFTRLNRAVDAVLGGLAGRFAERIDCSRLDREIRELYARPGRLLRACAWQLLGLVVGSLECWLALRLLGHPIGVAGAVALEASIQATRLVFFVLPGGLGVQEGGLLLTGMLLGLPAEASLALSLVKRAREIAFGIPALVSWQWSEARRIRWMGNTGMPKPVPEAGDAGC